MAKFFKIPFAATGDVLPVPDAAQPDGSVSYAQGFGPDYQRKTDGTDPLAKTVPRDSTNALFNDLTGAVGEIQLNGVPAWQSVGAPYPINAIVRHSNKNWVSQIVNNNDTPVEGASWSEQPSNSYTKAQIDTKLALKANSATTLSGYGITDAYTKADSDSRFLRASNNLSDVPSKATARTNLELGTAATANLTTSSTDTTAGRALRVADFGLGGYSAATADPDALQFSCFFRAFNSAKMPTLEMFSGIHTQGNSGNSDTSQIVWGPATNKTYTRTRNSAGSWSAWAEFYTTANVGAFMRTLLPAATKEIAQAALGVAITKEFVSGELTITASGLISIPHSFGARPKFITAEAVCKIASVGWSVGDVVGIAVSPFFSDTDASRGIQVAYDPVNVIAKIAASALAIMNKTSGGITGISNLSEWRLVLRAYV